MAEPRLRFTKEDGMAYPPLENANMGDYYVERNERGCEGLPVLTVSIHSGVSDGELDEDELGKRVKRSVDMTSYKKAEVGDLVFNMMRAWQGAVGSVKTTGIVSPAYIVAKPKSDLDPSFMDFYVQTKTIIDRFNRLSYGALDFRKRLYWDSFITTEVNIPTKEEQQKIADFLSSVDEVISTSEEEVANLEMQKKVVMKKIFSQEVRFKKVDGSEFPEWKEKTVNDCLEYEQPGKYIVHSDEYDDRFSTPVLTANKGFILGYTNEEDGHYSKGDVIIYDDFTMNMKYVDFEFKVKSSAIKMLTAKTNNIDLYFMFLLLCSLELHQDTHSRSYISIVEPMMIKVPHIDEQRLIADFLSDFDETIAAAKRELELWKELKKGLLQQMFV